MPTVIPEVTYGPRVAVPVIEVLPAEYKVITATTAALITTGVMTQIAAGWTPLGGVMGISTSLYAQALVKY